MYPNLHPREVQFPSVNKKPSNMTRKKKKEKNLIQNQAAYQVLKQS